MRNDKQASLYAVLFEKVPIDIEVGAAAGFHVIGIATTP